MGKSRKGRVIDLAIILKNGGIDFDSGKTCFRITTFEFDAFAKGYELAIIPEASKRG